MLPGTKGTNGMVDGDGFGTACRTPCAKARPVACRLIARAMTSPPRMGLRFHETPVSVSLSRSASEMTRRQFVGLAIIRLRHIIVLSHENIPRNVLTVSYR